MKKSEQRKQCHSSQSTGQVNSIASQGWQLFHVLADETSEDREEDNNQRRIPQRDRKETHHVKKSRAQPARRAETVFPRHVRERQMQQRGKPGRNKRSAAAAGNTVLSRLFGLPRSIPSPMPKKLATRGRFFRFVKTRISDDRYRMISSSK